VNAPATDLIVKRWPCDEQCDAAGCTERVEYAVTELGKPTAYLCIPHTDAALCDHARGERE
jgi:hypothetical protein